MTGPGLTDEGGEDSAGVDGVGAVLARAGFAEVRRCLGSRDRRAPQVEAEVKQDSPGHGVIGDEGDDPEPAAAVGACEDIHGEDLLQQVGPRDAAGAVLATGPPALFLEFSSPARPPASASTNAG